MNKTHIIHYSSNRHPVADNNFEEAFYHTQLKYSLRHFAFSKDISKEMIAEAIQKSLQICRLAGINSKHHFKQIFVFDVNSTTLYTDWLMSKKGFNLMIMQLPLQNENLARWLWQLANL
jgi:hypothetical protein